MNNNNGTLTLTAPVTPITDKQAQTPPPSMTEAGFSINVKIIDPHGQEVMLTFRAPMASQSDRLLTHYGATVSRLLDEGWRVLNGGARAATAPNGGAPLCPAHNSPMKASRKPGSYFCPRQLDDGSGYCPHKA